MDLFGLIVTTMHATHNDNTSLCYDFTSLQTISWSRVVVGVAATQDYVSELYTKQRLISEISSNKMTKDGIVCTSRRIR